MKSAQGRRESVFMHQPQTLQPSEDFTTLGKPQTAVDAMRTKIANCESKFEILTSMLTQMQTVLKDRFRQSSHPTIQKRRTWSAPVVGVELATDTRVCVYVAVLRVLSGATP